MQHANAILKGDHGLASTIAESVGAEMQDELEEKMTAFLNPQPKARPPKADKPRKVNVPPPPRGGDDLTAVAGQKHPRARDIVYLEDEKDKILKPLFVYYKLVDRQPDFDDVKVNYCLLVLQRGVVPSTG